MNRRVSPLLAGRRTELALLTEALKDAGQGSSRTVLISGEAGVGKTRLIREFADRLPSGTRLLTGACLDQSDTGLPYGPFRSILRDVAREYGGAGIAALIGEPSRDELARLLPSLGATPVTDDAGLAKARMFEAFRSLVETTCDTGTCVLVIEDAHWADPATQDLLSYLVSTLTDSPLLVLVSFRTEEAQTANHLRRVLTELSRLVQVIRIDLAGLTQPEVAQQLNGILGEPAPPEVAAVVHRISEGVPLFTEALIGPDGTVRGSLPASLHGLLLRMVEDLPAGTQQLLKAAAIGGTVVEHEVLAQVVGPEATNLTATIGPAIAAKVLVGSADGYAFRHGLIRDAIVAGLLPGETIELHRRYAEVLTATALDDPRTWRAATVARHWLAAREQARAFAAAWSTCGSRDVQIGADEKLQMLEMVLDLWNQVDEPSDKAGASRLDVLQLAADAACWVCESEKGLVLVEEAFKELAEQPATERSAELLLERGVMRRQMVAPGEVEDFQDGVRLASQPSILRAALLGLLSRALIARGRHDEARPFTAELAELADRLPSPETRLESQITSAALALHDGGDPQLAFADALVDARAHGYGDAEILAYLCLLHFLCNLGQHPVAIDYGRVALARAVDLGRTRYGGPMVANQLVNSLVAIGRWDEAVEVIDSALLMRPPVIERLKLLVWSGIVAVGRGDFDAAARVLRELKPPTGLDADDGSYRLGRMRFMIELAVAEGRADDLAGLASGLPAVIPNADAGNAWPAVMAAALAVDSLAGGERLREELQVAAAALRRLGPLENAFAETVSASVLSATCTDAVERWLDAAQSWLDLGQPYNRAQTLVCAAAALVAADERQAAKPILVEASQLARDLSARPLTERIATVARRARISLGTEDQSAPSAPFGLTERECEVLRLLVGGLSNREIAAELTISPKTAGVHISNILRKLDVPTRAAAASAAHRHHLL
ncbi:AAA family ATPase [Streptomyces sp. SID13031]|uniref:ATP-binding protein n=1 Tax=Streptomyces sp. SID13031 TaxID=2706046 RepID=UPI0013CA5AB6|nr:AAA family ATPase [Streptomyces sp. SID13031]NEA31271.1 AAA family ATPase [Streptomyces sp. SID13031]